ncbi:MAG: hypothetical protein AAGI37_06860 [Planctomycetota bacterium]
MSPSGTPLTPREREMRQALKDAQIRRQMLKYLNETRGNTLGGFITGASILELLQFSIDQGRVPRDEDHAADLLRDLVNAGYADERDDRESQADDLQLHSWSLCVTQKGTRLLRYHEEPDMLVADYRHAKPFNQE